MLKKMFKKKYMIEKNIRINLRKKNYIEELAFSLFLFLISHVHFKKQNQF